MILLKKICKIARNIDSKDAAVLANVAGAFVVKGVSLVVSLATVPAFMHYFSDNTVLGVWYTVVSVMGWILNFDLGVGNGLRNKLVIALVNDNKVETRQLISSAYYSVGGACLLFCALSAFCVDYIDWNAVYGISASVMTRETLKTVTFIVLCGMALQLLLKNVTAILYAMQLSAVNNFINLCVSVLQLLFILSFPAMDANQALQAMAVAYSVVSNAPVAIATIILFVGPFSFARPSIRFVTKAATKQVFGLGMMFFGAQLLYMFIVNTNEIFISSLFGSSHVVDYQVYYKLYSLVGTLMSLALTPVWSAVTLAIAQKETSWLRRLFRRLELFGLVIAILELLLVPFTQELFNIWLGDQKMIASTSFASAFAIFGAIFSYQCVVASFANGFGQLSTQLTCYTIGAVLKTIITIVASLIGLPWVLVIVGDAIALLPFCVVQRSRCIKTLERLPG